MVKKDAAAVLKLWNQQQENYKFRYKFSQEDVLHFLVPRDDLLWTWVIENPNEKGKMEITDFFSMHMQAQQCMN